MIRTPPFWQSVCLLKVEGLRAQGLNELRYNDMLIDRTWKKGVIALLAAMSLLAACGEEKNSTKKKAKAPATQVKDPISTQQIPTQTPPKTQNPPISWDGCGDQYYCDKGNGTISLPSNSSELFTGYNAEDVRACMKAVAANSIPTYGPWSISSASRSFSIFDQNYSIDTGDNMVSPVGARIVMLNITGILSTQEIRLDQPNTVYCVKSQMYFSAVNFKSCYPNNVIFLRDKEWLAANQYIVPGYCAGVPVWDDRKKYY